MTPSELYAVYCRAFAEYDRDHDSGLNALRAASPVELTVAAFAVADAENGTPLRSREQFERSLASGLDALRPLGLRAA